MGQSVQTDWAVRLLKVPGAQAVQMVFRMDPENVPTGQFTQVAFFTV